MMPLPEDKTVSKSILKSLKSFFGFHGDNATPLSVFEMKKFCLLFYLEKYKNIITSAQFEGNFGNYIEEIQHIFTSMCITLTTCSGEPIPSERVQKSDNETWNMRKVC